MPVQCCFLLNLYLYLNYRTTGQEEWANQSVIWATTEASMPLFIRLFAMRLQLTDFTPFPLLSLLAMLEGFF